MTIIDQEFEYLKKIDVNKLNNEIMVISIKRRKLSD
jgi:hypothetical protein